MNIHGGFPKTNEWEKIKKLYFKVFPQEERLDFELLKAKAAEGKGSILTLFDDDHDLKGMIYYSQYKKIIYIFYFGIDPECQSKGYGQMMLDHILKQFGDSKIILLIEELDANAHNIAQRIRRKNFYLRNGFADSGQLAETLGLKFELLHCQRLAADIEDYKEIKKYFYSSSPEPSLSAPSANPAAKNS
ncbi:MAG: GNAT family N-acetyltransferase [Clostridium sp.]|nr:GNAT family N-acetyltransferase [Clostridium sp.]